MTIALWVINVVLALVFVAAGAMKLTQPSDKLIANGMAWVEDSAPTQVKAVGAIEVLGAVGLILPILTGIAEIFTPLAAVGLALTMAGAIVMHVKRNEPFVPPVMVLAGAVASAVLGFAVV